MFALGRSDEVDGLLGCHTVPDAVARADDIVQLWGDFIAANFGVTTYRHLFRRERRGFVLPVSDGSANGNDAVHAAVLDDVAGLEDAGALRG